MAKFTAKSFDICAIGSQDNTTGISATGLAAAANVVSLPAVVGQIAYITGFTVTSGNPAATVSGVVTVTGLTTANGGGTLNYQFVESATLGGQLTKTFSNPIPASGANQAITVTCPAITSGAVTAVEVEGYYRPE